MPYIRDWGKAATFNFDLRELDNVDFQVGAVHAAGDTKIMSDEGAETNTANGFVDEGQGYSITLTAAEMRAARISIPIVDQTGPKAWRDTSLKIETRGHALAQHRVSNKNLESLIESQRKAHTVQGNIYYVDPINGATHASGARGGRDDPYSLVQDCHDNAITDRNHDIIILIAGEAAAITMLTEAVILTKSYFFIRGPGRDFCWTRSGNGDTIIITGDGIELQGFQLQTAATGAGDGIAATDADFLRIKDLWVNKTQGDGIHLVRCNNAQIEQNTFQESGQGGSGQGIHIVGTGGTSNYNVLIENTLSDVAGHGIHIEQGTTLHTIIQRNIIHGATGWGISIGGSSTDALVMENWLGNNASGSINDGGTTSVLINNQQWAKDTVATEARLAELDGANLPADIAALPTAAEVNAEVVDAISTDTYPEPGQGAPPATASLVGKVGTLHKNLRNKKTTTATQESLFNDDAATVDSKSALSDAGGTFTKGEMETGP